MKIWRLRFSARPANSDRVGAEEAGMAAGTRCAAGNAPKCLIMATQGATMLTTSNRRQQSVGLTGAAQSRRHPGSSRCQGTTGNEPAALYPGPYHTRNRPRSSQRWRDARPCATARRLGEPHDIGSVQRRSAPDTSLYSPFLEQLRCQERVDSPSQK